MVKLEKGVPIDTPRYRGKYPFNEMEVGDSFEVEGDRTRADNLLRTLCHRYAKKFGVRFTIRRTERGARVWRIA